MEQNIQPIENNNEVKLDSEGEPINQNLKKGSRKKVIVLILVTVLLIAVGAIYYIFFNKEDSEILPAEENIEIIKDEEAAKSEIDKKLDTDQDGLPDYLEKILGTDEKSKDTDGDSYGDFDELKNGYNPLSVEKYTEEEWEGAKKVIKSEDEGLYNREFGVAVPEKENLTEDIIRKMNEAIRNKDTELYLSLLTEESSEEVQAWSFGLPSREIQLIKQERKDDKAIITIIGFDQSDSQKETQLVLVKEKNEWKIDFGLTLDLYLPETSTEDDFVFQVFLGDKNNEFYNEIESKNYIVTSQEEWQLMSSKLKKELQAPLMPINFSNTMIIAVFQGIKPTTGYSIHINNVIEKEDMLEVFIIEYSPGSKCMTSQVTTSPYDTIWLNKTDKEVVFRIEKIVNNCN